MRWTVFTMIMMLLAVTSCFLFKREQNPLLMPSNTSFDVPPFERIREKHFLPAFQEAMKQHDLEIQAIVDNNETPTFQNTIEVLEYSGELLNRIEAIFFNLNSANTNALMQDIAKKVSPQLSKHHDNIYLNPELFEKIKTIYDKKESLQLSIEQNMLLEKRYKAFVRSGANLADDKKELLRSINEELSVLTLQFGENVLAETNAFQMSLNDESDLAGLPESTIKSASESAKEAGLETKGLITLHKPSFIPFLQYSDRRDLREKVFKAYIMQGDNNNENDNKNIIQRIASLRVERAKLLGYNTHADYILEENMAQTPEAVYTFLNKLWAAALPVADREVRALQQMIYDEGEDFDLRPWDWWYYAEKLRKTQYDLNEESLRPYFELENVKKGVFDVAQKLFGLHFVPRTDINTYHRDVDVYEVEERDGRHLGVLYMDFHPRASKRGGAWMTSYRKQQKKNGKMIHPIISIVMNFSKPAEDKPALLTLEEIETFFYEFGHALHGLLSNCTYPGLSGTDVPRDFVELPSQIMENWAKHAAVMKTYALHYKTGEPISDDLLKKLEKSKYFNEGFKTVEYLAASFLDMDWHTLSDPKEQEVISFENQSLKDIGLMPEIVVRYRSTYFRHIFSGGYSSGYYSYIWAEVLDADAFDAFKEEGLFDQETALSYRQNILERGGTEKPMVLYKRFRGREPSIEPLLKKRGLI